jgi:uncharacterized protein with FMN-binding domain
LAIGTGAVLIAFPPTLFDAPEVALEPVVTFTPEAVPELITPSPVVSTSPQPVVTKEATLTPKPEVTVAPTPKVTVATSATINGAVFAAGKYGNVQVQITVKEGVITAAKALLFPDGDSRSSSISATAIPELIRQTLAVQSAEDIDGATGASYTSTAWISSLQSALIKV